MAIREKTTVKLEASAECPSHSLANVKIRDLEFSIDEPVARGGGNLGPTPTDTALAALVGCTNVIAHKCAAALGLDIGRLTISASCEFDRRGVTLKESIAVPFKAIVLDVSADGSASDAQLQQLATEVAKYCPVSMLFRQAGTEVRESWHRVQE